MSKIHPRVKQLARDLGGPRSIHLTVRHQRDWLDALARSIQVTLDDAFRGLPPDDRDWPDMTWQAKENAKARAASQASTESGDSVAHAGKR